MTSLSSPTRGGKRKRVAVAPEDQRIVDCLEQAVRRARARRLDEEVERIAEREKFTPLQFDILRDEFQQPDHVLYKSLELVPAYFHEEYHLPVRQKVRQWRTRLRRKQRLFYAPIRELVEITGLGEHTVRRQLKRMEAMGLIDRKRTMRHHERVFERTDGTFVRGVQRRYGKTLYRLIGMRRMGRLYADAARYQCYVETRPVWGGAREVATPIVLSDIEAARLLAEAKERELAKRLRAAIAKDRRETHSDYVLLDEVLGAPACNSSKMASQELCLNDIDSFALLDREERKNSGRPAARFSLSSNRSEPGAVEATTVSTNPKASSVSTASNSNRLSAKASLLREAILLEEHTGTPPDRANRRFDVLAEQRELTRAAAERDRLDEHRQLRALDHRAEAMRAELERTPDDRALQARLDELDELRAQLWCQHLDVYGAA